MPALLEADVRFAVEACARLGPDASRWRYKVFKALRQMARALKPLDKWALQHRPTRHCDGWSPVLTAAFVHLLKWQDKTLPWALVHGFQVVGRIPESGIHRRIEKTDKSNKEMRSNLLGQSAIDFVDELEKDRRIDCDAEEILKLTLEEIELGLARPLESREELEKVFGWGELLPSAKTHCLAKRQAKMH